MLELNNVTKVDMDSKGKVPLTDTAVITSVPSPQIAQVPQVVQASVEVVDGVDFITQTDSKGRAITRAPAPTGTNHERPALPVAAVKPRSRFLQWFCCFVGATTNDMSEEVDEYAHTPPEDPDRANAQSVKASGTSGAVSMTTLKRQVRSQPQRGLPQRHPHIGPVSAANKGKKCLVLDLDETLVHSSLEKEPSAQMVIPVQIDNGIRDVYVIKRPGVDEFLKRMGEHYEIIIYTASLSKYADPLLDQLDVHKVISKRLFRENCVYHQGHYVKDLSLVNRDLQHCIIVDNSPMSYSFHPENAIDCGSFIDDPKDIEMWQIGDFLLGVSKCDDVRLHCKHWREWIKKNPKKSTVPPEMLSSGK